MIYEVYHFRCRGGEWVLVRLHSSHMLYVFKLRSLTVLTAFEIALRKRSIAVSMLTVVTEVLTLSVVSKQLKFWLVGNTNKIPGHQLLSFLPFPSLPLSLNCLCVSILPQFKGTFSWKIKTKSKGRIRAKSQHGRLP